MDADCASIRQLSFCILCRRRHIPRSFVGRWWPCTLKVVPGDEVQNRSGNDVLTRLVHHRIKLPYPVEDLDEVCRARKGSNVLHETRPLGKTPRIGPSSERFSRVNTEFFALEQRVRTGDYYDQTLCAQIAGLEPGNRSIAEGNELPRGFEPWIGLIRGLEIFGRS